MYDDFAGFPSDALRYHRCERPLLHQLGFVIFATWAQSIGMFILRGRTNKFETLNGDIGFSLVCDRMDGESTFSEIYVHVSPAILVSIDWTRPIIFTTGRCQFNCSFNPIPLRVARRCRSADILYAAAGFLSFKYCIAALLAFLSPADVSVAANLLDKSRRS